MRKILPILIVVQLIGCGGEKKDTASDEQFRIPDSLLAPLEKYTLIRDEYHPVRGGVIATEEIELHYPASPIARYIAVTSLDLAHEGYEKVVSEIGKPSEGKLVLIGAADIDEYQFLTRKDWWYYGVIQGDTIIFEPFDIMLKRTIADEAITQKIAQAALLRRSGGRIPPWMREAIASRIAEEGVIVQMQTEQFRHEKRDLDPPPGKVDDDITQAVDMGDTRIAFYAAYRMFGALLDFAAMEDVYRFIDLLAAGETLERASQEAFEMDYRTLLDRVRVDGEGRDRGTSR
jgi:hypothetical protein